MNFALQQTNVNAVNQLFFNAGLQQPQQQQQQIIYTSSSTAEYQEVFEVDGVRLNIRYQFIPRGVTGNEFSSEFRATLLCRKIDASEAYPLVGLGGTRQLAEVELTFFKSISDQKWLKAILTPPRGVGTIHIESIQDGSTRAAGASSRPERNARDKKMFGGIAFTLLGRMLMIWTTVFLKPNVTISLEISPIGKNKNTNREYLVRYLLRKYEKLSFREIPHAHFGRYDQDGTPMESTSQKVFQRLIRITKRGFTYNRFNLITQPLTGAWRLPASVEAFRKHFVMPITLQTTFANDDDDDEISTDELTLPDTIPREIDDDDIELDQ